MEKRGRGRPPKVPLFSQDPEFFEVFLPDRISHQLLIPPDFVKHFDGKIPETVILRDLAGKVWHVDLKQDQNGVFLKKGWNRFVNDKFLVLGEFMVFRYNKKSAAFTVRIFGLDACKKDEFQDFNRPSDYVKEEQESDQEPTPVRKRKRPNIIPKNPETSRGNKAKRAARRGRFEGKDNNLETKTDSVEASPQQHDGFEGERFFFTAKVHSTNKFQLHVPRHVIRSCNAKVPNEKVLLYNEKGKLWRVKLLTTRDGRTIITKGWSIFRKDNSIQFGDTIECRLVLGKGGVINELHIKIL